MCYTGETKGMLEVEHMMKENGSGGLLISNMWLMDWAAPQDSTEVGDCSIRVIERLGRSAGILKERKYLGNCWSATRDWWIRPFLRTPVRVLLQWGTGPGETYGHHSQHHLHPHLLHPRLRWRQLRHLRRQRLRFLRPDPDRTRAAPAFLHRQGLLLPLQS